MKQMRNVPPITPPMIAPRLFEVETDLVTLKVEEVDVVGPPAEVVVDLLLESICVLEVVVVGMVIIVVPVDICVLVSDEVCGAAEVVAATPCVGVVLCTVAIFEVETSVLVSAALVVEALVVSENVSGATFNFELNVTPTGPSTPGPPGVGTSCA